MKKLFLYYLITLLPVFAFAQGETPILKDVAKKALAIPSSFKFNDQIGVFQLNLNDTTFELIALDNKMQTLWRTQFKGSGVACGKFKGYILAIADSSYSFRDGNMNPYYAYLIDPQSGKTLLQNQIFKQKAKHQEMAEAFFGADGGRTITRGQNSSLLKKQ